ncbi:MAG: hypothetical protein ABMA02_13305 [Saprospiraceae bacterium]
MATIGLDPIPNTNVYAGMWIENRATPAANATYREGMYIRLANPITQNSGSYSINFRIANAQLANTFPANPIRIGVYGVWNPTNTVANNPTNTHFPANTNLWSSANPSVQVVLLGTITPPNNFSNTWWAPPTIVFNSNMLPTGGITHIMVTAHDLFRPTVTGKLYVKFDEFCIRRADPIRFCCPISGVYGVNKVINGDFESGNTGFISSYVFDPALATGSVTPGEYNIVNGAGATSLNVSWVVQDPSTCQNNNGMFLMVNGSTGGTMKRVWKNAVPIPVNNWGRHKFCFRVKNLKTPPVAVPASIEVRFSPGSGVANFTESIPFIPAGACNWQTISRSVDLWGTTSNLDIEIWLNEGINGANDLAFDNIALIEVPPCPANSTMFNIATTTFNTHYNVTATATIAAPCTAVWWEVCEVTPGPIPMACVGNQVASSNSVNWWTAVMPFNTYNGTTPGSFAYGKLYKITRGTWGDCHGWSASSVYVACSRALQKPKYYTEEQLKKNKGLIQEMLK